MHRLLALGAVALVVLPLSSRAQQPLACGSEITGPITLTEDMVCNGPALTILGGVVDLGGHTISSDFPPVSGEATIEFFGATLRNGRVVRMPAGQLNIMDWGGNIEDLTIDGGILAVPSSATSIKRSTFLNGAGVRCTDVGLVVSDSTFTGPSVGSAIGGSNCALSATHNNFSGYSYAFFSDIAAYPIHMADNVIDGGGIHITSLTGEAMVITGNQVTSASSDGIFVSEYDGAAVKLQLVLMNNTVIGNAGDGIRTINTHGGSVTVTSNLAVGNFGLGIDAQNAHDGGGNRAGANGDPAECVGVPCSGVDLPSELGMCLVDERQCEDALGACNGAVIGANGDFNGDGAANIVDSTIFRRSLAGAPVP